MPKISVIIPTYNRATYVLLAIDSVLKQSYSDYEIIVVDDGSTDNTRKSLIRYEGKIRYIYQENAGVSSARNVGIITAKSEWVAFLDSDDEWAEDYLSLQMSHVGKYPNAIAHITNVYTVMLNGERSSLFFETKLINKFRGKQVLIFEKPLNVIVKHSPWFLQSTIIRKDILFKAGLFDVNLSIAEDLDVISQVSLKGPFTLFKKEMVNVHRRNEEIENLAARSRRNLIEHHKAFEKVYKKLRDSVGITLSERLYISSALSRYLRAQGNVFANEKKRYEARQFYMKSLSYYPSIRSLIRLVASFLPVY